MALETMTASTPNNLEMLNIVAPHSQQDWRSELDTNGFVVLKSAIPVEKAVEYQKKAIEWYGSFSEEFKIDDPSTWTDENLPVSGPANLLRGYGVEHEKFIWEARMEPGVVEKFEELWGTDELLVSFDALNVTLPNRPNKQNRGAWQHVDQSPNRKGLHCVQGLLNLSESGEDDGGFLVYPGSNKLIEEFFETQTDKASWTSKDYYQFTQDQLDWFLQRGIRPVKVCASPGDLIIWDSRTIHQGCEPSPESRVTRTVIYVTYTPARMAKPEALEMKAKIFHSWQGTTHWPHDHLVAKGRAILADGTQDPRDKGEPREKPILSHKLLRYAGVEPYRPQEATA